MRILVLAFCLHATVATMASSATYVVHPDGTGDYPTIQAAVDAASAGDIIELTDGVFRGAGNRDISLGDLPLTVLSQSDDPGSCIIDVEEADVNGVSFDMAGNWHTELRGVSVINAGMAGIYFPNGTGWISNCIVAHCHLGISCVNGSGVMSFCTVHDNESGIQDIFALSTISHCTIAHNRSYGIRCRMSFSIIEYCIISDTIDGEGIRCEIGCDPQIFCCDLYDNYLGDWIDCISDQQGVNGNISENPLYCDPANRIYHCAAESPCMESNNPECGQIGTLGVGCSLTGIGNASPPLAQALLHPCHPNPFNPATLIRFSLPESQWVRLSVLGLDGREVISLLHKEMASGEHAVTWNGSDARGRGVPSGVYLYRLETGSQAETRRMTLIQ